MEFDEHGDLFFPFREQVKWHEGVEGLHCLSVDVYVRLEL